MNFIEAIRNLERGLCEGIKRSQHLNIVTLKEDVLFYGGEKFRTFPSEFLAEDWVLVEPKPRYDFIEVTRYWCSNCDKILNHILKPDVRVTCACGTVCDKLTGTTKRTLVAKVKRREEVLLDISERARADMFYKAGIDFNGPVKYFAEWEV